MAPPGCSLESVFFNHSPEIFVRVNIELRIDRFSSVDDQIISDSINVELINILPERDNDFAVDCLVDGGISGGHILFPFCVVLEDVSSCGIPEIVVWANVKCSVNLFTCSDDVGVNDRISIIFCGVLADRIFDFLGGIGGHLFPFCVTLCFVSSIIHLLAAPRKL